MSYRIKDWDDNFETNDTRKLKSLHWVKIPNRHDSLPFRLIAGHPKATDIFTAWVLMVQVASKGKREDRGNLPLSPDELGIVTGFPAKIFELAIDFLKTPKIGWIEQSPGMSGNSPDASGFSPTNPPLKERREGTEGKEDSLGIFRSKFDEARKSYPGTKNGIEPEWENFQKKHGKNTPKIVPLILPAIQAEKEHKERLKATAGAFCPEWKNFKTWINNSCWTQELSEITKGVQIGTAKQRADSGATSRVLGGMESLVQGRNRQALPAGG